MSTRSYKTRENSPLSPSFSFAHHLRWFYVSSLLLSAPLFDMDGAPNHGHGILLVQAVQFPDERQLQKLIAKGNRVTDRLVFKLQAGRSDAENDQIVAQMQFDLEQVCSPPIRLFRKVDGPNEAKHCQYGFHLFYHCECTVEEDIEEHEHHQPDNSNSNCPQTKSKDVFAKKKPGHGPSKAIALIKKLMEERGIAAGHALELVEVDFHVAEVDHIWDEDKAEQEWEHQEQSDDSSIGRGTSASTTVKSPSTVSTREQSRRAEENIFSSASPELYLATTPDDPMFPLQTNFDAIRLEQAWGIVNAQGAWTNAPKVTVQVLDSGMNMDHPDLGGEYFVLGALPFIHCLCQIRIGGMVRACSQYLTHHCT